MSYLRGREFCPGRINVTRSQVMIVSYCAFIASIVVWALIRAAKTGKISSRGWTFDLEDRPDGFFLVVVCDLLILVGCVWFALHTVGIVGDFHLSLSR